MDIDTFVGKLATLIVNPLIRLMFAVAVIVFIYGVYEFIKGANNPGDREKGVQHITWGIVGLVIMSAVFGILELLTGSLLP